MKRLNQGGFTVLEMLIVIVIITIMVSAGGFYYVDLQRQTVARKAREDAINLANIINDIYRTGSFGVTKSTIADLNVKRGTYPDIKKMSALKDRIMQAYGDQFSYRESDGSAKNTILVSDLLNFKIANGQSPMTGASFQDQAELQKNANKIIYAPFRQESPESGSNHVTCYDSSYTTVSAGDDYEYRCDMAVVYFVAYEKGTYQIRPIRKLVAGVASEY